MSLEIFRLEYHTNELDEQAQSTYNERELMKQKVTDVSTDLDAITRDNTKIKLLWNDVLICIQQREKSFQNTKDDFL